MKHWLDDSIFYEIYPQSFFDSNNDGIGDIPGITAKLDYIRDLGAKNGVSMVSALSGTAKYGVWSTLPEQWRVYPDAVSFVRGGEKYDARDDGQPVNVTLGELVYNSAVDNGAEFVFEARAEQLVGDAASGITGIVMPAAMHRCHSCQEYTSVQELTAVAEVTADLVLSRD